MDVHKNARTLPHRRMLIVERLVAGWSVSAVAAAGGITAKTVRKWRDRHAAEGATGVLDRTSRPHRSPARLDDANEDAIEALRRQRLSSPAIARRLGHPVSTIGQVLRRRGLGRLSALDPRPPIIRYEREQPGELIHIDIKKLGRIDGIGHRITGDRTGQRNRRATGRGLGWEYLHVAIDDRSRLAYTQLLPSERKEDATAFLESSLAWFKQHGVTVQRVMTDWDCPGLVDTDDAFARGVRLCPRPIPHIHLSSAVRWSSWSVPVGRPRILPASSSRPRS